MERVELDSVEQFRYEAGGRGVGRNHLADDGWNVVDLDSFRVLWS